MCVLCISFWLDFRRLNFFSSRQSPRSFLSIWLFLTFVYKIRANLLPFMLNATAHSSCRLKLLCSTNHIMCMCEHRNVLSSYIYTLTYVHTYIHIRNAYIYIYLYTHRIHMYTNKQLYSQILFFHNNHVNDDFFPVVG